MQKTWLHRSHECGATRCRWVAAWLSVLLTLAASSAKTGIAQDAPASTSKESTQETQPRPQDEEKTSISVPDEQSKTDETNSGSVIEVAATEDPTKKQAVELKAQDSRSTAPTKTPKRSVKALRRPTAPTDASALADRPPRPKFSRAIKNNQSNSYDLTFDDLAFEIKDGEAFHWSMITPEILEYNGSKIRLRGYIRPSFKSRGLEQFIFVRDNQECCFGPGAALFDCVLVKMAAGYGVDYTVRPVTLEGEFYMRKYAGPDGNVWAIFRMKEARLK